MEGILINLLKKFVCTLLLYLAIILVLPYIFLTIHLFILTMLIYLLCYRQKLTKIPNFMDPNNFPYPSIPNSLQ